MGGGEGEEQQLFKSSTFFWFLLVLHCKKPLLAVLKQQLFDTLKVCAKTEFNFQFKK